MRCRLNIKCSCNFGKTFFMEDLKKILEDFINAITRSNYFVEGDDYKLKVYVRDTVIPRLQERNIPTSEFSKHTYLLQMDNRHGNTSKQKSYNEAKEIFLTELKHRLTNLHL